MKMSGPGRRGLRALSEFYNTRSGSQAAGTSAPPQGTTRRRTGGGRRSRAPPPPPDPSERPEDQVDEDAHQVDQVDEHAQTHQEDAHTQEPADDEEARALQGEAEADEDDEQQEDTAGGSGSSSGVYQRGPASLPDRPPPALRPVARPVGQAYATFTFLLLLCMIVSQ